MITEADPTSSGAFSPLESSTNIRSGVFWAAADPDVIAAVDRHNQRVGTRWQHLLQRLFVIYLLGPVLYVLMRLAFRIRVKNGQVFDQLAGKAIYAYQHHYEWDAFLVFLAPAWRRSLLRPWLFPHGLVGHLWMKTRPRRLVSLLLGCVGVRRGAGPDQSAFRRVRAILADRRPATISVAPTGPVRKKRGVPLKPGVAYAALDSPDVPVLPIAMRGVRDIRLSPMLFFRRPILEVEMGHPLYGRDVAGQTEEQKIVAILQHIEREWRRPVAHSDLQASPSGLDEDRRTQVAWRRGGSRLDQSPGSVVRARQAAQISIRAGRETPDLTERT